MKALFEVGKHAPAMARVMFWGNDESELLMGRMVRFASHFGRKKTLASDRSWPILLKKSVFDSAAFRQLKNRSISTLLRKTKTASARTTAAPIGG
jgi:hypothetical protein